MLVEQEKITGIQDHMDNNEGITPEILPTEKVRVLISYNPEVAHYNAAVIRSRTNPSDILILLREVSLAAVKSGAPDKGIYLSIDQRLRRLKKLVN